MACGEEACWEIYQTLTLYPTFSEIERRLSPNQTHSSNQILSSDPIPCVAQFSYAVVPPSTGTEHGAGCTADFQVKLV